MIYREYLGPFKVGKIDLTHHKGLITRGQRIRVTAEEAAKLDEHPQFWRNPEADTLSIIVKKPNKTSNITEANSNDEIKIKRKVKRKRKARKTKGVK